MGTEGFIVALLRLQKPARRIILENGDAGQRPVTKIGGVPWWPQNIMRPTCSWGHLMEFMAQVRLNDVPEIGKSDMGLLSFHYCTQCSYDGAMSFGFRDAENRGYDVRMFELPEKMKTDEKGTVTETTLAASKVTLSDYQEVPSIEDMPAELSQIIPGDYFQGGDYEENVYRGLIHRPLAKLGGWPSWPQSAEWPKTQNGKMIFVCQLDAVLGERTVWATGCAMLFVSISSTGARAGELCIQTT